MEKTGILRKAFHDPEQEKEKPGTENPEENQKSFLKITPMPLPVMQRQF
jgi:hypothetical protein